MWAAIGSIFTMLVPVIIKVALYLFEKNKANEEVRRELLKFIVAHDKDFPTYVNDKYRDQLKRLKEKIKKAQDEEKANELPQ